MTTASAVRAQLANPFPGLRPFVEGEQHLFFGRESQVDAMIDKLAATRFLAVIGTSGSGKSSLVNCGLKPALRYGLLSSAGTSWRIAHMRPGSDPIKALAHSLVQPNGIFGSEEFEGISVEEIVEATLRMSKLGLVDAFTQSPACGAANLLVVVDQFEEIFRYRALQSASDGRAAGDNAVAFVNLLLEASSSAFPIYVVLTMRSDFLGDCAQFFGLPEAINHGEYLVPRMSRDERRSAIAGPVAVGGGEISPVLLTRLVNDVGDNPDQLSILQHALNRTWAQWQSQGGAGAMALEHYEAIGTMAHALDYHAEKAFGELRDERQRLICQKVFQAITDKGTDARGIRRPTRASTLCEIAGCTPEELTGVLAAFRKPSRSFVMPPATDPLTPDTVVDISHESLMRIWNRLKDWVEAEADSAARYFRLVQNSNLHGEGKAGLMTDPELSLTLEWQKTWAPNAAWAKRYHPDFEAAMSFLEFSRIARDAVLQAAEEDRKRELRRTRQAAIILGSAAVIAVALSVVAFVERSRALHQESIARAQYEAELARDAAQRAANVQLEKESQLQNDTAAQKDTQRDQAELDAATAAVENLSSKAAQQAAQALAVMGAGRLIDTGQISHSDLFDTSAGTQVTGTSGVLASSNPNAMFNGAATTSTSSGAATVFADGQPVGTNHWIEWRTKSDVTVKSVAIYAEHLPLRARRAMSHFKLYAKQGGQWVELAEFRPSLPYAGSCASDFCKEKNQPPADKFLSVCINVDKAISASEYKAKFEQAVSFLEGFSGPEVLQLDGFSKGNCEN